VLRAIAHPATFVGMLVGFLAAVAVHALAQAAAARTGGDRSAVRGLRRRPVSVLDPFGAVAAVLVGPAWGVTRELSLRRRGRAVAALLAGPAAALLLGAVVVAGYLAAGGPRVLLAFVGPLNVTSGLPLPADQAFLLAAGVESLAVGVLSLVPLPPLTGWRVLMLFAGRSVGWQRARLYLEERNFGVLALLVLLILPIGVGGPLLLDLLDVAVRALLNA
jgi:hypothetical protein